MKATGNIYGKGNEAKARRLHSLLVRARGACERCGDSRYEKLECAHIIRRTWRVTATMEDASWALCHSCHRLTEAEAWEFMALVDRTIGLNRFEELLLLRQDRGPLSAKLFWAAEVERLTARCAELGIDK